MVERPLCRVQSHNKDIPLMTKDITLQIRYELLDVLAPLVTLACWIVGYTCIRPFMPMYNKQLEYSISEDVKKTCIMCMGIQCTCY